jgi:hypothetical protein
MPSLRVLFVRLFPKLLGSTQHSNGKYYANSHSHAGGNISVNKSGKLANTSKTGGNEDGITYSQTFTVQYGNQFEHDETHLVQLSDLDAEAMKSTSRISEREL